jgi:hypothetical protein
LSELNNCQGLNLFKNEGECRIWKHEFKFIAINAIFLENLKTLTLGM